MWGGGRGRAGEGGEEVTGNVLREDPVLPYFRVLEDPVWGFEGGSWLLGSGGGGTVRPKGGPWNFRKSREDPDLGGPWQGCQKHWSEGQVVPRHCETIIHCLELAKIYSLSKTKIFLFIIQNVYPLSKKFIYYPKKFIHYSHFIQYLFNVLSISKNYYSLFNIFYSLSNNLSNIYPLFKIFYPICKIIRNCYPLSKIFIHYPKPIIHYPKLLFSFIHLSKSYPKKLSIIQNYLNLSKIYPKSYPLFKHLSIIQNLSIIQKWITVE